MPIQKKMKEGGKSGIAMVKDASASLDAEKAMASLRCALPAAIDDHIALLLKEHGAAYPSTPPRGISTNKPRQHGPRQPTHRIPLQLALMPQIPHGNNLLLWLTNPRHVCKHDSVLASGYRIQSLCQPFGCTNHSVILLSWDGTCPVRDCECNNGCILLN